MCQYCGKQILQKQQEKLDELFKIDKLHILIMNVEALSTSKGTDFAA